MPKVSFYLRNDDLAAWRAVEHKTEFIHNALTEDHPPVTKIPKESLVYGTGVFSDANIGGEFNAVHGDPNKTYDFCKHDQVKGFCKIGCK